MRFVVPAPALIIGAVLTACATYDDSALHQTCRESALVKDLPAQVAARESKCRSTEVWSSDRHRNAPTIDFGGKKDR